MIAPSADLGNEATCLPNLSGPHRLFSLWDIMQEFKPEGWFLVSQVLTTDVLVNRLRQVKIEKKERKPIANLLNRLRLDSAAFGFSSVVATTDRMIAAFKKRDAKFSDVFKYADELQGRIADELGQKMFVSLTVTEAEYYREPRKDWKEIIDKFPETISDIEEAKKCFAFARYAAAVFHSIQVLEFGLIHLGKLVGAADPLPGWSATTNALRKIVDTKHDKRTAYERHNFAFFEQMHGLVEALKNAWRNKISHAEGRLKVLTADFTPQVAEEIIYATRAFMRRLVTDAPSPPS